MALNYAPLPLLATGGIVLTTSVADLLVPDSGMGNVVWEITSQLFVNNDTVARAVTLYRIPPAGSAAQATLIMPGVSIAAATVWGWNKLVVVPQGWKISGKADANSVVTWSPDGIKRQ